MSSNNNKIKQALNKAYLKLPPTRQQIELFKTNLSYLLKQINDSEGEEFHKNEISEFLKKTYYSPNHYINTKARYDMVIHNGKDNFSSVGVIIEAKSPGNRSEMPTFDNLNAKAIRELILYYLRERITNKNLELKHLIATNLYEWFIFDAHEFEKYFANNKSLIKQFTDFEEGRSSGKDTFFFYNSIAAPYLENLESEIKFTHFDLRNFETIIGNDNPEDDSILIPLFKFLSPEHLLKLPFKNDSNSLDKDFYRELLHIIGLEETKQGSKKLIGRASEKTRNYGSLLESAISILNIEDCITQIPKPSEFGVTKEEQLFNIALELVITWINRVLFLKLLEGQLVRYNQRDRSFRFLERNTIPDYDALNKLFFSVLAIPVADRDERFIDKYSRIPYLNSSLFEPTELEHKTIRISNLDDTNKLPIHINTILKNNQGKRETGEIPTLIYLFDFLDAYNFSSEGSKGIQEENKTLINASVLGLIFEKINGYKDGSYFTPGFITQYICHETITRAVVQKFNDTKGWNCVELIDVHNKIEDKAEANRIINTLRICDPAVGSGHFLVSALNEILSIKSELKILMDKNMRVLRDYHFEVINDELIVSDPEGEIFEYNPRNKESSRVQEAIFNEKQLIIENCLFGVDINPNSVKICRLRLWIELLKHAFYKQGTDTPELETLPNIDINIKCGNSLVSRYPLDTDIKTALKSSKWTVDNYREAVMVYRNAETKDQKRSMEKLIGQIKTNFESEVLKTDKRFLRLNKLKGDLLFLTAQQGLFELDRKGKEQWNKKLQKLVEEQKSIERILEEIRHNKIYNDAFEWRFEFPEVLSLDGSFLGFDVIIGNPPYSSKVSRDTGLYAQSYNFVEYKCDPFALFIEKSLSISNSQKIIGLILPLTYLTNHYYYKLRKHLLTNMLINKIIVFDYLVFEEANVDTSILILNSEHSTSFEWGKIQTREINNNDLIKRPFNQILSENRFEIFEYKSPRWEVIKLKVDNNSLLLKEIRKISLGVKLASNASFINSIQTETYPDPIIFGKDIGYYNKVTPSKFFSWKNSTKVGGTQNEAIYKSNPKIFIQAIRNLSLSRRIVATIDTNSNYFIGTVNGLTSIPNSPAPNIDDYFLLGLINSKLLNAYFKGRYTTISLTAAFLGNLPIKIADTTTQELIARKVVELIETPANEQNKRTSLINEIDQLVYDIYGLTEDEIAYVDSMN